MYKIRTTRISYTRVIARELDAVACFDSVLSFSPFELQHSGQRYDAVY